MKSKPTVLVADDDVHVRSALRIRLRAAGLDVYEAGSGLEVLREYQVHRVDAIILDHQMPDGEGRSIARLIRKESDVPIILLTGHAREEFRKLVQCVPDVYFLAKPFDSQVLTGLLETVLQRCQEN